MRVIRQQQYELIRLALCIRHPLFNIVHSQQLVPRDSLALCTVAHACDSLAGNTCLHPIALANLVAAFAEPMGHALKNWHLNTLLFAVTLLYLYVIYVMVLSALPNTLPIAVLGDLDRAEECILTFVSFLLFVLLLTYHYDTAKLQ